MPARTSAACFFGHSVCDDEVGAFTREGDGDPFADSRGGTGHDGNPIFQPAHRCCLALAGPRPPYRLNLIAGCHVEPVPHQQHRGLVLSPVVAGDAVFRDHDVEIVEHGVACRGLDTALRRASADHDRLDAIAAQEHVEVGSPEAARPILAHHELILERREFSGELVPRRTGKCVAQRRLVATSVLVHSEVEPDLGRRVAHPVGERRVLRVHDGRAGLAGGAQQGRQARPRLGVHGEVDPERREQSIGLDEIALHVDHDQSGMRGIDEFLEFGQDILAFDIDHFRSSSSRV